METQISPSYNIKMRHSLMRRKEDNASFLLVLIQALEVSGTILCPTTSCCVTYFGPNQPCIVLGLKPRLRTSPPGRPQPRMSPIQYKLSSSHHIRVWILFSSSFPLRNRHLHCNCVVESFCCESGPPFLFFTTVVISPFVIRA
jgi:hypothetical protein